MQIAQTRQLVVPRWTEKLTRKLSAQLALSLSRGRAHARPKREREPNEIHLCVGREIEPVPELAQQHHNEEATPSRTCFRVTNFVVDFVANGPFFELAPVCCTELACSQSHTESKYGVGKLHTTTLTNLIVRGAEL